MTAAAQRSFCSAGRVAGLLAFGLFGVAAARAQDRVVPEARIESARGMALGTGMRAAAASTQAQAENPANLPIGGLYHVESLISYEPQQGRLGWGASAVDSMTSQLAAGLSVRGLFLDNEAGDNGGWEARLSLGMPIGDVLLLGVAGRYAKLTLSDPHARVEPTITEQGTVEPDPDEPPDRTFRLRGFTMDAACTLRIGNSFAVSALGYNLVDRDSPLAPVMVGGSATATLGDAGLSLGGDVLVDLNKHEAFSGPKLLAGGGLEYLASGVAPIRAGYRYDQGRDQHAVTGGIGFVQRQAGFQVSLRQVVGSLPETTMMAAVQYFVH